MTGKKLSMHGKLFQRIKLFRRSISGATAIEYGLIAAIIAIGLIAAVGGVADQVVSLFTTVETGLTSAFN